MIGAVAARVSTQGQSFARVVKTLPGESLVLDLQSGGAVHLHGADEMLVRIRAHLEGHDGRSVQGYHRDHTGWRNLQEFQIEYWRALYRELFISPW